MNLSASARTARKDAMSLAIHEAGHAVARFVLDELSPLPSPLVQLIAVETGGNPCGVVEMQNRSADKNPIRDTLRPYEDFFKLDIMADVLEICAGPAAQACFLYGQDQICLLGYPKNRSAQKKSDAGQIRTLLKISDGLIDETGVRALWHDACWLVISEWPGIKKAAGILLKRGTMQGDEFESVWRARRPDSEERARRVEGFGSLKLGDDLTRHKAIYESLMSTAQINSRLKSRMQNRSRAAFWRKNP
jgi:hypothetical protein